MSTVTPIQLCDVVQQFGRKTLFGDHRQTVLDQVSLTVEPGRILCLLGPSGCGKTTLVNLIMGIMVPVSGSVSVFGEQAPYPTARKRVGFMPQDEALYDDITAEENLHFFGTLLGMVGQDLDGAINEVLSFTRLEGDRKKLVSHFSGGMKRRLSLGIALLHSPDLFVLDEPTVGLDPEHRRYIWDSFRKMADGGTTLLITTHIMDEAERCDHIAMLRDGRVIALGSAAELKAQANADSLEAAFIKLGEDAEGSAVSGSAASHA